MKTREELAQECIEALDSNKCILTTLSTGVGKTKIAIDCLNKICDKVFKNEGDQASILIVVDRKVHIKNWKDEIEKWGGIKSDAISFCCYASLHKYKDCSYDAICLDEVHHIQSEKRLEALRSMKALYNIIGLSATLPKELLFWFKQQYKTHIVSCTIQEAIESNILPDPTIYLLPLLLDNTEPTEEYVINPKMPNEHIVVPYKDRLKYVNRRVRVKVKCTRREYLTELDNKIDFLKRKVQSGSNIYKVKWLRYCSDRLIYLANCKNDIVLEILKKLKNNRTLTFCANIDQTKVLGKNNIHSKNKKSQEILNKFNDKKIKHITACHILNEGVNLIDCKYAIFANINASHSIQVQRVGRSLRHKSPIIIIPFYRNTREEELVRQWMNNYNRNLIKVIYSVDDI